MGCGPGGYSHRRVARWPGRSYAPAKICSSALGRQTHIFRRVKLASGIGRHSRPSTISTRATVPPAAHRYTAASVFAAWTASRREQSPSPPTTMSDVCVTVIPSARAICAGSNQQHSGQRYERFRYSTSLHLFPPVGMMPATTARRETGLTDFSFSSSTIPNAACNVGINSVCIPLFGT